MKEATITLFSVLFLTSCALPRTKLHEKIFKANDITVSWYQISEITTVHDFVDITRWGHTKNIMEANLDIINSILINGDTVIIKVNRDQTIYSLAARTLGSFVRLDSSAHNGK